MIRGAESRNTKEGEGLHYLWGGIRAEPWPRGSEGKGKVDLAPPAFPWKDGAKGGRGEGVTVGV